LDIPPLTVMYRVKAGWYNMMRTFVENQFTLTTVFYFAIWY